MKGNKMFPQCGFSNTAVMILKSIRRRPTLRRSTCSRTVDRGRQDVLELADDPAALH